MGYAHLKTENKLANDIIKRPIEQSRITFRKYRRLMLYEPRFHQVSILSLGQSFEILVSLASSSRDEELEPGSLATLNVHTSLKVSRRFSSAQSQPQA